MSAVAPAPQTTSVVPSEPPPPPPTLTLVPPQSHGNGNNHANTNNSNTMPPSNSRYYTAVLQSPPVVTLTAYIPTSAVGAVIGRRGQNVEELQRRAAQSATTRQPVRVSVVGHDLLLKTASTQSSSGAAAVANSASAGVLMMSPTSTVLASGGGAGGGGGGAGAGESSHATTAPSTTASTTLPHTYSGLDFSDPNWTPVVIRADVEAAMAAGRGLEEVCNGQLDQVVLDVPLPRHRHATVVGKHGITIAKLSADHDVRIMIPHRESRHDMIQLEGDLVPVQQCLIELLQLASRMTPTATSKRDDGGTLSGTNASAQQQQQQQQQQRASVVSDSLMVPVAPSQTKIRNVARKTDCSIKKKKHTDGWQLFISGKSNEQVTAAISHFRKWRDEQPQQSEVQQSQQQSGDGSSPFNKKRRPKIRGKKKQRTPLSVNEDTN